LREALRVEALAVVGDAVVSKRLNAWISQQEGVTVFGVGDPRMDSFHRASGVYAAPVLFEADAKLAPHAGWKRALSCATKAAGKALASERTLTEPTAIADATAACAAHQDGTIFYGSSMPIRDADVFALHPPTDWSVGSNRGASGIDGLLATAVGHALASAQPVVAFVGDVSMLHDLNSLQLAASVETPLVIVLLNNDGGGIFRYLPIAKNAAVTPLEFAQCFTTPHGRSFALIAKAFGLACETPTTRAALSKAVMKALRRGGATMIEVLCTAQASEEVRARVVTASTTALSREFRG
jgi:2-succinyl-5-enolpyruvyl-6-hydroxy-3-cyclohexene-1-carboxylate synthase